MFLTTHAAAGIFIAHQSENPLVVFLGAFVSHFVLDFIPHGDEKLYHDEKWKTQRRYRRVVIINAIDVVGVIGLSLWAVSHGQTVDHSLRLLGILGSILPDFLSHLFPVIHQRFSWLFIVRWLYAVTKPTGVRYMVRVQDWLHDKLHHDVFQRDISFQMGLVMQIFLTLGLLSMAH